MKSEADRFEVIPAIDLLGGKCVRLTQGRYDAATVYSEDPGDVAKQFVSLGATRLHVVDLDGARAGAPKNIEAIRMITERCGDVPVQLGGGLRALDTIESILSEGVSRAILGTIALREPAMVEQACKRFPGQIAVGIDARQGQVAVEGWFSQSEVSAVQLAERFEDVGVAAIIFTDIERDGTLEGPSLESTLAVADAVTIPVIVSGGVGSIEDIRAAFEERSRGLAGVIVGRAIYTGAVSLSDALEVVSCS